MAYNFQLAHEIWSRYQWMRDNGHRDYLEKANSCEDFFAGLQWKAEDLALLRAAKRPALTINKIISTISNVLGEQIFNRSEISYKPRNGEANSEVADSLTKVFMQISDNNQLDWVRSEVFADGIVTSRGFYDVRLDFTDSMRGELRLMQANPKNVLIDPDADEYDPEKWGDVITTKWLSSDNIALLYDKDAAKELDGRTASFWPYGYDSFDRDRDRFGKRQNVFIGDSRGIDSDWDSIARNYRIIERQHRKLDVMKHFVDLAHGDTRPIPEDWDRNRIALFVEQNNVGVIRKQTHRVRWSVVCDNLVLHDDWSPYSCLTIVPYFPYFRRGRTIGLVENLLGPQELLNKTSSQELHIVNTTANSGWKIKQGALTNMSPEELEHRGAQTGIVLELTDMGGAEKIQPNPTPTGLDRISYKAEEHIKSISGVSDSMLGFDREDVAAKAIIAKQQRGSTNLAKPLDNLLRSDHILARTILGMVQTFYTEERVMFITNDKITGERESFTVNQVDEKGTVTNDLTLGEYAVIVTSQPVRDSFEDSQFEHALGLYEKGIPIPPDVLVDASRLKDKAKIVERMRGDINSPEAQRAAERKERQEEAATQTMEAEASSKAADVGLKQAQTEKALADAESTGAEGGVDPAEELNLEKYKIDQDIALQREKMERELALAKEKQDAELEIKREEQRMKREQERRQDLMQRAAELHKPTATVN